jgi:hypothetical protein
MNAEPVQMPVEPPEGLVAVNPQNLEADKHYFVTLVEVMGGELVPTQWWDFVSLRELTQDSATYDRIKTLLAGPHGNFWYKLDPEDDPDEDMELTQPRDGIVESVQGQPDGQYFIFYTIPPPQQPQQQPQQVGGRRRRSTRRRSTRRRRSIRRRRI